METTELTVTKEELQIIKLALDQFAHYTAIPQWAATSRRLRADVHQMQRDLDWV